MFLLLVENHLCKPKRHIIPHFCIVQQIVSVWASKIHLNQWNTIIITFQKWSLKRDKIFCFHEIAMRANPWPVLFNRDPHTSFCRFDLEQATNPFKYASVNSQQCKENASAIQSISLYDTFRCLQALSNTFKLSVVQPASIDQGDSC